MDADEEEIKNEPDEDLCDRDRRYCQCDQCTDYREGYADFLSESRAENI